MSIDRLSGAGASTGVLSSTLGVARCGGSAGCVLGVLWAVPAAVLGGGYPVGVSISSLACTRYCHYQYFMVHIARKGNCDASTRKPWACSRKRSSG